MLYLSTHQFPFYPGTGDHREAGRGRGLGATINVPMPAGCGDAEYVGVVDRIVVPAAIAFRPDLILVSCGFDAHRDDPLASMEVGLAGYRAMAMRLRALADSLCRGRIVVRPRGRLLPVRRARGHARRARVARRRRRARRDAVPGARAGLDPPDPRGPRRRGPRQPHPGPRRRLTRRSPRDVPPASRTSAPSRGVSRPGAPNAPPDAPASASVSPGFRADFHRATSKPPGPTRARSIPARARRSKNFRVELGILLGRWEKVG